MILIREYPGRLTPTLWYVCLWSVLSLVCLSVVCLSVSVSERLDAMAQPAGEGVTWYIFSPDGQLLQTKIGSWTTPSKDLWPGNRPEYQYRQEWAIDSLWGAANGPVGSYQGSEAGGFPLPPDFWGTGACGMLACSLLKCNVVCSH